DRSGEKHQPRWAEICSRRAANHRTCAVSDPSGRRVSRARLSFVLEGRAVREPRAAEPNHRCSAGLAPNTAGFLGLAGPVLELELDGANVNNVTVCERHLRFDWRAAE